MTYSKPDIDQDVIQAYIDGRLDAKSTENIRRYLEQHPIEAKQIAAMQKQRAQLKSLYTENETESLHRAKANFEKFNSSRRSVPLSYAASIVWLTLGMFLGWGLNVNFTPVPPQSIAMGLPNIAMVAHAVYSPEVRHPVEVTADQEAHLVKWLSKRLDRKIKTPNLNPLGYGLIGGRLLPAQAGPAAQFMYENSSGDRLTLYVIARSDTEQDTAFHFFERDNIKVFYWNDMNMGFALSGGIGKDQLLQAADQVYKELSI